MGDLDPVIIQRRLAENYSQMTEDELAAVAEKAYDLIPVAKEPLKLRYGTEGCGFLCNQSQQHSLSFPK
jgi:hypothetical protein